MNIGNYPIDGGPVTIGVIQVGASDKVYELPDLTWDNLSNTTWGVSMNDIHMNMGECMDLPPVPMSPTTTRAVVYRATIWLDSDPTMITEYTGQMSLPAPEPTPIP